MSLASFSNRVRSPSRAAIRACACWYNDVILVNSSCSPPPPPPPTTTPPAPAAAATDIDDDDDDEEEEEDDGTDCPSPPPVGGLNFASAKACSNAAMWLCSDATWALISSCPGPGAGPGACADGVGSPEWGERVLRRCVERGWV